MRNHRRIRRFTVLAATVLLVTSCACWPWPGHPGPGGPIEPEEVSTAAELYAVPEPIPRAPHGTLLRYQPVSATGLPGAVYRILYTSTTVAGRPTVVTGTAIVPAGTTPARGWPVLTHGHGSTGLADDCAPSKALGVPGEQVKLAELSVLSSQAIPAGYLIASTDYEGQGGPGRHPFLVGESEGRSMLDAALAAGQLPGIETDDSLSIAGYSQGGHAALWARQLAARWVPQLDVVGTVAGAPASELTDLLRSGAQGPVQGFAAAMMAAGQAAAHPRLDLDSVLTADGRAIVDALDQSCNALPDVPTDAVATSADITRTSPWRQALAASTPGVVAGSGPVLVVHSQEDRNVPIDQSATLQRRLCAKGVTVERRVLPTGDHVISAVPSYQQGVAWLAALREGAQPATTCAA